MPNSDTIIPQTQFQHHGDFASFDHGNDEQTNYGIDNVSDDAAFLKRTSVMKTTELVGPSSPKLTFLSRDSIRVDPSKSPTSSLHFTFGQPSKVGTRGTPLQVGLEFSQASTKHSSDASIGPGFHPKELAVAPDHHLGEDTQDSQHDASHHAQGSYEVAKTTTGDHEMRPMNGIFGTEEKGSCLPDRQSATPPSAQLVRPSQDTEKPRTTKQRGKRRSGRPTQQQRGAWPPRENHSSNIPYQTPCSALPIGVLYVDGVTPENHQGSLNYPSVEGQSEASPSNEAHEDILDTSMNAMHHTIEANLPKGQNQCDVTRIPLRSFRLQATISTSPTNDAAASQPASMAFVEELPLCVPDEVDQAVFATPDHLRNDPIPMLVQSHGPNSALGRSTEAPGMNLVGVSQQTTQDSVAEQTDVPQFNAQRPSNEAVLHEASYQGGSHRVNKLQKKPRGPGVTPSRRSQAAAVPTAIEEHLNALRVSLLAEQFRKDHERSASTKQHDQLVAELNKRIKSRDEIITQLQTSKEELGSGLTRLTGKAKTNQNYVAGLQKDYEKLQKSVTVFQAQNTKILQEKIAEVENERNSLYEEFQLTLGSFEKIKKNMKATIDDMFVRLQISESKRTGYAETLSKQNVMLQEERTRREALEKNLTASVQAMQKQLGENTLILIAKLEAFQSQAATALAVGNQDSNTKECLKAIRALQSTPFLTTHDVQKAERMLHFVHERLDAGFRCISQSGKSKDVIMEETKLYITGQMQTLKGEVLKYEELVADNQKKDEAIALLKARLEAEQQHYCHLDTQFKTLQQAEADLNGRYFQLECELGEIKNAVREEDLDPLITEQELSDLRQQLNKVTEDLTSANEKTQQVERLRQEQEKRSGQLETKYNGIVEDLRKMAAASKQMPKPDDITRMREEIVDACQGEFREKESRYKNEVHRLVQELEEREHSQQKLLDELDVSKDQLHTLRKDHKALNFDLHVLRKRKEEVEVQLAELHSMLSVSGPGPATMSDHLQKRTEELQSSVPDYAILKQQLVESANTISKLQVSHDRLQAQVSEHPSSIETLLREADDRLTKAQGRAQSAIEESRSDVSGLQLEKQALASELEQTRLREQVLEKCEAKLILERDSLRQQLEECRAADSEKDTEILRLKADATREQQMLMDNHREELEASGHRQAQTIIALKEAEASLRRKDDEYQAKIKCERQKAEDELSRIVAQYEFSFHPKGQQSPSQVQTPSPLGHSETPTRLKLNLHAGPNRMKVSRQKNSTLNVSDSYNGQFLHGLNGDLHRHSSDRSDNLFETHTGAQNPSSEGNISQINAFQEEVPGNHDAEGPTMSMDNFHESLNHTSRYELGPEKASSTDLSLMNSDVLDHLGREVDQKSGSGYSKCGLNNKKHTNETFNRSDNISESGSRSSQSLERPKSQANTASRLMPPTVSVSKHFTAHQSAKGGRMALDPVHRKSNKVSSPEYMPPPSSRPTKKQTYGHRQPIQTRRDEGSPDPLQASGSTHGQKRRGSPSHTGTTSKKTRYSSPNRAEDHASQSRHRPAYSSQPSIKASRSRTRPKTSQTSVTSPAASRSQARNLPSSVAPHTPNYNVPSGGLRRSRGQQASSSSARGNAPSRYSTRSKSRGYDIFDQRFDQELP